MLETEQTEEAITDRIAQLNDLARLGKDRLAQTYFTTNLLAELEAYHPNHPTPDLCSQLKATKAMRECSFSDDC